MTGVKLVKKPLLQAAEVVIVFDTTAAIFAITTTTSPFEEKDFVAVRSAAAAYPVHTLLS